MKYLKSGLGDDIFAESALHVILIFVKTVPLLDSSGGRRHLGGVELVTQRRHRGDLVLLGHLHLLGLAHYYWCVDTFSAIYCSRVFVGDS